MKCFHVNELCCAQHKLFHKKIGGGLPYKIMYFVTDARDKMLFQVMKNGHVVIVFVH